MISLMPNVINCDSLLKKELRAPHDKIISAIFIQVKYLKLQFRQYGVVFLQSSNAEPTYITGTQMIFRIDSRAGTADYSLAKPKVGASKRKITPYCPNCSICFRAAVTFAILDGGKSGPHP